MNKNMDTKLHYRMYKSGKQWVYQAIAVGMLFGIGGIATMTNSVNSHADTVQTTTNNQGNSGQSNASALDKQPTLASNDLTKGQVTGTANEGNTVSSGINTDYSDALIQGQTGSSSNSSAISYDGFTNSRAKDVDPANYNANDSNSSNVAYQKGQNDYADYQYGIIGAAQNNTEQNSWGTMRGDALRAAADFKTDLENGTVKTDAQLQAMEQTPQSSMYSSVSTNTYLGKMYVAAYTDARNIYENEKAKGEYLARTGQARPDDSQVTTLAVNWNTHKSTFNLGDDPNDATRTNNAYKTALTSTDTSKDIIGISSQTYDVFKLAEQQALNGVTDTSKLDDAYNNLINSYNNKYKGQGQFNSGMPVTVQTQPTNRSQNPTWKNGTQYGLGITAGANDAMNNKTMTLGTDVNYNAGYQDAYNGAKQALSDFSIHTTQDIEKNGGVTGVSAQLHSDQTSATVQGYRLVSLPVIKGMQEGVKYIVNNNDKQLFERGLSLSDYENKPVGWAEGVDGIINYWNLSSNNVFNQIPLPSSHVLDSAQFRKWAMFIEVRGVGASRFTNPVDASVNKVNALMDEDNLKGLYTSTDGKSITLSSTPNSNLDANYLSKFNNDVQNISSGATLSQDATTGLVNQAIMNAAQVMTNNAKQDNLIGSVLLQQNDDTLNKALSGNVGNGTPYSAVRAAYEYSIAKGFSDASKGVDNTSSLPTLTREPYTLGFTAYKDIKIAVDNNFGANEQPYNNDQDMYNIIQQQVKNILSNNYVFASSNIWGADDFDYAKYLPNSNNNFAGQDMNGFFTAFVKQIESNQDKNTLQTSTFNSAIKSAIAPYLEPSTLAQTITSQINNILVSGMQSSGLGDNVGIHFSNRGNTLSSLGANNPNINYGLYTQDFATETLAAFLDGALGNQFALDSSRSTYDKTDPVQVILYNGLKYAYNVGQQVKQGTNDAINGKNYTSADEVSDIQFNANLGARQGISDLNNLLSYNSFFPQSTDNSSYNTFSNNNGPAAGTVTVGGSNSIFNPSDFKRSTLPSASYGYQLFFTGVIMNVNTSAYQFVLNLSKPTSVGANFDYDLAKKAFDNAQHGLNAYGNTNQINSYDGLNNLQSLVNQAWSDAQAGIDYVNNNGTIPTSGSIAYQAAAQAYYDASMKSAPRSNGALYMDIYNQHISTNEGSPYPSGIRAAIRQGIATEGNALIQHLFNNGKADGQTAYNLAMQENTPIPSTFNTMQVALVDGIRDGIHNYFASRNDQVSIYKYQTGSTQDQNNIYQAAYEYAQSNLESYSQLLSSFKNSDIQDSTASDAHAYYVQYGKYMQGYNAGKANQANPNANDQFINAGYTDGLSVYNAVQSFIATNDYNYDRPLSIPAHDAYVAASNGQLLTSTEPMSTYSSRAERDVYRLTAQTLLNAQNDVINAFKNPTGPVNYTGDDAVSKAKERTYEQLVHAFNDKYQSASVTTNPIEKIGEDTYARLLAIANVNISNPSLSPNSNNTVIWYAVHDGLGVGTDGTYKANQGPIYDMFYHLAKSVRDNQDALNQAQQDKATADSERDAANTRANQANTDKATAQAQAQAAEQAETQAKAAQAAAEAQRDSAIQAQHQAEQARDAAIKAQKDAEDKENSANSDKAQAEQDKANAIEAQQRAESARDAAIKAQQDAETQRDNAIKAQQQAQADKDAALKAQKKAEDKATQAQQNADNAIKQAQQQVTTVTPAPTPQPTHPVEHSKQAPRYIKFKKSSKSFKAYVKTLKQHKIKGLNLSYPTMRVIKEEIVNKKAKITVRIQGRIITFTLNNRNDVMNAYYSQHELRNKNTMKVKVLHHNIQAHKTNKFTEVNGKVYKAGTTLTVKGIITENGISRFRLSNGTFITANKYWVQVIK